MSVRSEENERFANVELTRAKRRLSTLQKKIARLSLLAAEQVDRVRKHLLPAELKTYLSTECKVPRNDLNGYLGFHAALGEHSQLLIDHSVSFPVVKALLKCDPEARRIAVGRIASGATFDTKDIARIRRDHDVRGFELDRVRILRRASRSAVPSLAEFSKKMGALADRVEGLMEYYGPADLGYQMGEADETNADYLKYFAEIRERAGTLLPQFELFYGREHAVKLPSHLEVDDLPLEMESLGHTHAALKRLVAGTFGHLGGFGPDESYPQPRNPWIYNSLSFARPAASKSYCKHVAGKPLAALTTTKGVEKLSLLELCAGAGGQSLGLDRANFDHVALYENDKHAVATLVKNRADWNVQKRDITGADFTQYKGKVTLVAGGVPCQPYTASGARRGSKDKRDLFREAVRVVKEVEPQAFFFENVRGLKELSHTRWRARILTAFRKLGYDVAIHEIDAAEFGIAQRRRRVIIVGLPKGQLHRFKMPKLEDQWNVGIGPALEDLLLANRTSSSGNGKSAAEGAVASDAQAVFDHWAETWLEKFGEKVAPTVAQISKSPRKRVASDWSAIGIDIRGGAAEAPTPDDLKAYLRERMEMQAGGVAAADFETAQDDGIFRPKLTVRMLARLQGFPDEWLFEGSWRAQVKQIGNAFPPPLARAIGLAIHTAICGEEFDTRPVLEEALINLKARRRGPSLNLDKANRIPDDVGHFDDEDELSGRIAPQEPWSLVSG